MPFKKQIFTPANILPLVSVIALFPLPAFAAGSCNGIQLNSLANIVSFLVCLLSALIPILVGLAVVLFMWYVVSYVINQRNAEERAKAAQFMIWGIIALFVMVSVWGLVAFVTTTFGLGFLIPQLQ